MLSGVTVFCFFASYTVALALEVSRLFFRMSVRLIVMVGFGAAGLIAHTAYLWHRASIGALPLSSWHDWYLIAAWILALAYLALATSRPQTNVGLFLLPIVLCLTAIAWTFPQNASFSGDRAKEVWEIVHGVMLLLGTVTVSLGFIAGLMYLIQSWRLKANLPPQAGLRLPSLEWLQSVNKQALVYSSGFIALGLLAGIILNAVKAEGGAVVVPWTDPVILSSAVLLVWLLGASVFELVYKPAQQGRKVAYVTIASFLFLALVMTILMASGHAPPAPPAAGKRLEADRVLPRAEDRR